MMKTAPRSLSGRIREFYDELPPTERRLADVMLDLPGDVASYSATELARLTGVSNAAVSRLVQRLGFRNYEELRLLAREAKSWGSPLYALGHDQRTEPDADFVAEHVHASTGNILSTFEKIDPAVVDDIVEALATAHRIWLLGFRNGHFLAAYLRWQIIQVRGDVHCLAAAGETLAETVASFAPKDVLVVFGLRRRVRKIEGVVAAARSAGMRIAYIADHGMAEDPGATWLLHCATRSPAPLDNHAAVVVLCHVLAGRLLSRMGPGGRRHLAEIEELHDALEEL